MSFGFSIGDFILLAQLAKDTVQNARRACGSRDELVREVESLHIVLRRVRTEVSKSTSIINRTDESGTDDNRRAELNSLARHCRDVLRVLSAILDKYNALSERERSVTKLWKQVKFGNGEMKDLANIRSELATHTQAFSMFLNLLSIGSQGKVEEYMDSQGWDLREIKSSLNWVMASLQASSREENSNSILTTYTEDDKDTWKVFRRGLIKEGFSHRTLKKHRKKIQEYLMELGERGALDNPVPTDAEDDNSSETSSSASSDGEILSPRVSATSCRNSSGSNQDSPPEKSSLSDDESDETKTQNSIADSFIEESGIVLKDSIKHRDNVFHESFNCDSGRITLPASERSLVGHDGETLSPMRESIDSTSNILTTSSSRTSALESCLGQNTNIAIDGNPSHDLRGFDSTKDGLEIVIAKSLMVSPAKDDIEKSDSMNQKRILPPQRDLSGLSGDHSNPQTRDFVDLPPEWSELLNSSAITREDYEFNPQAVFEVLKFYSDMTQRVQDPNCRAPVTNRSRESSAVSHNDAMNSTQSNTKQAHSTRESPYFRHVLLEEVEDAEYLPRAHPNCFSDVDDVDVTPLSAPIEDKNESTQGNKFVPLARGMQFQTQSEASMGIANGSGSDFVILSNTFPQPSVLNQDEIRDLDWIRNARARRNSNFSTRAFTGYEQELDEGISFSESEDRLLQAFFSTQPSKNNYFVPSPSPLKSWPGIYVSSPQDTMNNSSSNNPSTAYGEVGHDYSFSATPSPAGLPREGGHGFYPPRSGPSTRSPQEIFRHAPRGLNPSYNTNSCFGTSANLHREQDFLTYPKHKPGQPPSSSYRASREASDGDDYEFVDYVVDGVVYRTARKSRSANFESIEPVSRQGLKQHRTSYSYREVHEGLDKDDYNVEYMVDGRRSSRARPISVHPGNNPFCP